MSKLATLYIVVGSFGGHSSSFMLPVSVCQRGGLIERTVNSNDKKYRLDVGTRTCDTPHAQARVDSLTD